MAIKKKTAQCSWNTMSEFMSWVREHGTMEQWATALGMANATLAVDCIRNDGSDLAKKSIEGLLKDTGEVLKEACLLFLTDAYGEH